MSQYLVAPIGALAKQMAFTPPDVRREQLDHAEELFWQVDPEQSYPLDFVIFRLTGYRADGTDRPTVIVGEALRDDLLTLVERVSDTLDDPADRYDPPPLDLDAVCAELGVTAKSISRYRKQGLFARRLLFRSGATMRKRLAFLPASVERFAELHQAQLETARRTDRISDDDRHAIVTRARRIAGRVEASPFRVAQHLAGKFGRSVEAIRRLLVDHDQRDPRFAIFREHTPPLTDKQRRVIARAYRRGVGVARLCERFGKTRDAIYRAINRQRADDLQRTPIRFVESPTFTQPDAERVIMGSPLHATSDDEYPPIDEADGSLLDAETEQRLFVRYNFVKFRAAQLCDTLDAHRPKAATLDAAETLLRYAGQVRQRLARANLGLVVATARRHLASHTTPGGTAQADLVGEGNLVLLRAIDTFDVTRGNRFSTYLSWALMRRFAQRPAGRVETDGSGWLDEAIAAPVDAAGVAAEHDEQVQHTVRRLLADLHEREREVLVRHYGIALGAEPIERPQTLAEIGEALGVSAERARQIEKRAVGKLRAAATGLGISVEDLLTRAG